MSEPMLRFERVSKCFEIFSQKKTLFRFGRSLFRGNPIKRELWALKDVSFEVAAGEKVAVIGLNGAGKTTLLRLASHIFKPSEGSIQSQKRVYPVLNYALGINPYLSIIDNIYIIGAYYGILARDLTPKIPEILNFCELEAFAYVQVKDLSAGQRQRIGFSVFLHCQDEVLACDESASVADMQFQVKAGAAFLRHMMKPEKTLLVATHSLSFAEEHCSRVLWLYQGSIKMIGTPKEVIPAYRNFCVPEGTAKQGLVSGNPLESENPLP